MAAPHNDSPQTESPGGVGAIAAKNPGLTVTVVAVIAILGTMGVIGPAADSRNEEIRAALLSMDYRLQRIEEDLARTSGARWSAADMRVWVAEMSARNPDMHWVTPIPAGAAGAR